MVAARLVLNHSTWGSAAIKQGVVALAARLPEGTTLSPGRLATARGKREGVRLHVTSEEAVGSAARFKLIARHGRATQEVFLTGRISRDELEAALGRDGQS